MCVNVYFCAFISRLTFRQCMFLTLIEVCLLFCCPKTKKNGENAFLYFKISYQQFNRTFIQYDFSGEKKK